MEEPVHMRRLEQQQHANAVTLSRWLLCCLMGCAVWSCTPCEDGATRRDGQCITPCNADFDCRGSERCEAGECVTGARMTNTSSSNGMASGGATSLASSTGSTTSGPATSSATSNSNTSSNNSSTQGTSTNISSSNWE